MKNFYFALLVSIPVILSGCASILNGKYQTVLVHTSSNDAKVYVNDEEAGSGQSVAVKMQRDADGKQIRLERKGYKPEYKVEIQHKKSPLYAMSWIPFGILVLPPFYDVGPKSYNYDKEDNIACTTKIPTRQEGQKYVYLYKTTFDLKKEDFVVERYSYNNYLKSKKAYNTSYSEENIEVDNSIFTNTLNKLLAENLFTDTTNTILKDKTNTIYVSATVKKLVFNEIFERKASFYVKFLKAETTIEWEIFDVYHQSKYKTTLVTESGEFSADVYDDDEYTKAPMEDAITTSLYQFLNKEEVQGFMQLEESNTPSFSPISMSKPISLPNNLEEAQSATVTISHKDGHGSGLVISKDGYIITNYHVVAGEEELTVIFNDGDKQKAELVRANEFADIALIKVNKNTSKAFLISSNKNYKSGEDVFAIGTPTSIELGQTLSKGIISGIRKQKEREVIQTDVSVNPGNSGGALVNRNGELVGVVNSKLIGVGIEGIAFCIPAKDISELLSIAYY